MKSTYKHTDAMNRLVEGSFPTEADIDAMDPRELAEFLAENGVDLYSMESEVSSIKSKFEGKLNLARARKKRLGSTTVEKNVDLSSMSKDQLIEDLVSKYGSIENIPLAARNFRDFSRMELESLYQDLYLKKSE
jgi:hypothetical protein